MHTVTLLKSYKRTANPKKSISVIVCFVMLCYEINVQKKSRNNGNRSQWWFMKDIRSILSMND